MPCGEEQRTEDDFRQAEVVWILEKKGDRGSMPQKEKGAAEQCTGRSPGKHSKRGGQVKEDQTNLQNAERSVVEYWDRKDRHS